MRNAVTVSAVFSLLTFAPFLECQDPPSDALFTPDQLDNLLAQIALYPDPLLAQILVAATFPDQIEEAARFVRSNSNPDDIDGQSWDVSVKAVAHYPTVIEMMADQLDWTTALGQAYVNQPDDVMASVQRLRADAEAAGNLQSNDQMQVAEEDGNIEIWPEQPVYIYIPIYDPEVVYSTSGGFSWGPAYPIGSWLNIDFDWHAHRVVYHGWQRGSHSWVTRSFPFVRQTPTYVNGRLRKVTVNRGVTDRRILYGNLDRYQAVHRGVNYTERGSNPANPTGSTPRLRSGGVGRNNRAGDPPVRDSGTAPKPGESRQTVRPPRLDVDRPQINRTDILRPEIDHPEVNRPQPQPRPSVEQRPAPSTFSGSRPEMQRPAPRVEAAPRPAPRVEPPPRPAPAPRAEPAPRVEPPPRPAPAPRAEPAPRVEAAPRPAPAPRAEPAPAPRAEPAHAAPAPAASHDDGGKKR